MKNTLSKNNYILKYYKIHKYLVLSIMIFTCMNYEQTTINIVYQLDLASNSYFLLVLAFF